MVDMYLLLLQQSDYQVVRSLDMAGGTTDWYHGCYRVIGICLVFLGKNLTATRIVGIKLSEYIVWKQILCMLYNYEQSVQIYHYSSSSRLLLVLLMEN